MTRTRPLPSTTRDRWRAELGVPFALGAATVTVLAAGAVGAAWLARLAIDTLSRVLVHPEARSAPTTEARSRVVRDGLWP